MQFQQWLRGTEVNPGPICEIGMKDCLVLRKENDIITIAALVIGKNLSDDAFALLKDYTHLPWIDALELFLMAEVLGKGPKVFRPTSEQMFALEQMTVNLSYEEFQTPFDTVVVELPDEYVAARSVPTHHPCLSVFHRSPVGMLIHSVLSPSNSLKTWIYPQHVTLLEEWFEKVDDFPDEGTLSCSADEHLMEQLIRRAVVNYCLLLDEVGIRKDGPAIPNQYAKLVKWCKLNNQHTPKNRVALQTHPIVYSMARTTELVRVVDKMPGEEVGAPTGRKVHPHIRRGHYRMQVYGKGRIERKRIRIPMMIVNKHLLIPGQPLGAFYATPNRRIHSTGNDTTGTSGGSGQS